MRNYLFLCSRQTPSVPRVMVSYYEGNADCVPNCTILINLVLDPTNKNVSFAYFYHIYSCDTKESPLKSLMG